MRKMVRLSAAFICVLLLFSSCKKKDDEVITNVIDFSEGVLISNEGPFSAGTGTISFYNRSTNEVMQDIFQLQNGFPAGNIVQSVEVYDGKAFVVVNNAEKIQVVNLQDFMYRQTIGSLSQPRYFMGITPQKGYVTQWGDGSQGQLKVVDLLNGNTIKTIDIGKGSDRMIRSGRFVFACNAGGFDPFTFDPVNDSAIAVIDTYGDSLYRRIQVGYNPGGIVEDMFGKLWVICYGITDYNNPGNDRNGALVRVDPSLLIADYIFQFNTHEPGMRIAINETKYTIFYKVSGAVFSMNATSQSLPSNNIIARDFYGLGFDPVSQLIYGTNATDFNSSGYVVRYEKTGALVDSFPAGIIPGNFYFIPE